jgi:hypothetical protein
MYDLIIDRKSILPPQWVNLQALNFLQPGYISLFLIVCNTFHEATTHYYVLMNG